MRKKRKESYSDHVKERKNEEKGYNMFDLEMLNGDLTQPLV